MICMLNILALCSLVVTLFLFSPHSHPLISHVSVYFSFSTILTPPPPFLPVLYTGVYLPLLWEASFCWHTPIALAYTRGHFSALVSMDSVQPSEAGVWSNRSCDAHVTYLPLVDSEGRMLPVHFLTEQEVKLNRFELYLSLIMYLIPTFHSPSLSLARSLPPSFPPSLSRWVVRNVC